MAKKKGGAAAAPREFVNTTPHGEKKDLSKPMADQYFPAEVEASWDAWWEAKGLYKPRMDADKNNQFIMVIPPPNVTGALHLGHALMVTLEDTIARFWRMKGKNTVWVPGVDHAGIATQSVVERRLAKDRGVTRHDLGREAFLKEVWSWKEQYGGKICSQLRKMGSSLDWSREAFTMSPQLSRAVTEAFVRMFDSGKLYRANRLVNWSCALSTALADIEVDTIELTGPTKLSVPNHARKVEFGVMHDFEYEFADEELAGQRIRIGTTRIETMLGDVAVAVHPKDSRYTKYHGKMLKHPFFPDRLMPILTDDILVDMEKGTGAVKITPAHDPNDYACGVRHSLERINILDEAGKINDNGGEFAGLMRYVARYKVIERLTELGLYVEKKPNAMALGVCSRTGDVIEPVLRPQWWVDCKEMAKRSTDAVRNGELKISPEQGERTFFHWLDNIQPWCVSRQLWWGHRIPAWMVAIKGQPKPDTCDMQYWVVARNEADAQVEAAKRFPDQEFELSQDPDVLDTWFSSGLFPFAVFGWPEQTPDLKQFYPTSLLETGGDILFFWVARMVMMGLELTGQLPFTEVFLHPMVRDKHGGKMSKSKGNVIDPLHIINGCTLETLVQDLYSGNISDDQVKKFEKLKRKDYPKGIPQCGADALRFGLLTYMSQARSINLDTQRVVGYSQFCNKLWNATRFSLLKFPETFTAPADDSEILAMPGITVSDRWILSRLNHITRLCNDQLPDYEFSQPASGCYDFFLKELCDVYLELLKPDFPAFSASGAVEENVPEEVQQRREAALAVLYVCLERSFRLMHPFMPFVTEELWHRLPGSAEDMSDKSIMVQSYPTPVQGWDDTTAEENVKLVDEIAHSLRSQRFALGLGNAARPEVFVCVHDESLLDTMKNLQKELATLASCSSVTAVRPADERLEGCASTPVSSTVEVFTVIQGLVDFASQLKRLNKEKTMLEKAKQKLEGKFSNAKYLEKTPQTVQDKDRQKLSEYNDKHSKLEEAIAKFEALSTQ